MLSFSLFRPLAMVAFVAGGVVCSEFHARAATVDADFHLYAYSLDSTRGELQGLPVFYGDGKAYAGTAAPAGVSETYNVTLRATTSNTTFTATPDNGTLPSQAHFYIDTTTPSSFGDVGFTSSSTNSTQNITGFGLYGAWAFHVGSADDIQMDWYVEETDTEGTWAIKWNNVGSPVSSGVPVALRTQAPGVKGK
ncbi:hypothetical protein EJ05DRAFT_474030 [Pseudovirgaria hyperparasitica]|uniref:Uncharacterized protein n=1 Tax=Pseudovirgaria hyperparasitica TaxID=470096 RepID=A0A6A6WBQ5_9PEZI|nr:uncharacterized protein EJ05DRAFT_474030 [Pseudovirgaria hyperparasitica]KAF2760123.1 hypothetical protein EJ05DRAFT_474030 [Pseudovirgaria hyperparasitica]